MSHWLDGLFEGGSIIISADGTELPKREILEFDESFDPVDEGDRIRVRLGEVELDGDVINSYDENIVTTISGDEEQSRVVMKAVQLVWDEEVSEGVAAIVISDDELGGGALEIWHDGNRSAQFLGSGPVIGHSTALSRIVGGLRLPRLDISASPVTLDATSKATLLVIDASLERTVHLPSPSDGRVFFWVLVGGTSNITIGRAGHLINGAASNYTPPNNSRGLIISDGTDWFTFAGLA